VPILFNIFINDLDDRTVYTLSRLANDAKLGEADDTPDGCTTFQRAWTGWRIQMNIMS